MRWMRRIQQIVGGVGMGLVLALSSPEALMANTVNPPSADGDLAVATRTQERITGEYGLAGSLVTYDARRTGADQATVTLIVNGKRLEGTVDFAARSGSWTGHGAILGTDGKTALLGMERALAGAISPKRSRIGPHETLLYRAVMFFSEAPAGFPLTGGEFAAPTERTAIKQPSSGPTSTDAGEPCLDPITGEVSVLACQVGGEDGILYMPTGCTGGNALECHDSDSHCYRCTVVAVGKAVNCKGRCGGGCCVPDGLGIYTYDCLDHDQCCGDHGGCFNPWDGECGDEYGDAFDDFWLASTNCGWQC